MRMCFTMRLRSGDVVGLEFSADGSARAYGKVTYVEELERGLYLVGLVGTFGQERAIRSLADEQWAVAESAA